MRYSPFSKNLFQKNRERFYEKLPTDSLAVFVSNAVMPSNGDGHIGFVQNNSLFYLSGIDQENTYLILRKYQKGIESEAILFVLENNEKLKTWEGEKLSFEEAKSISGIQKIFYSHDFMNVLKDIINPGTQIFLPSDSGISSNFVTQEVEISKALKSKYPDHAFENSESILSNLRIIKQNEEIKYIKVAVAITKKGMEVAAKGIKNGIYEYEIEASIFYEFTMNKSRRFAFDPIVASGEKACILHYVQNDKIVVNGELILIDIGAEYGNYNGDMTRTFPVAGLFSERQKAVYDAVLRVFYFAKELMIPGNTISSIEKKCNEKMVSELIDLGLISESYNEKEFKKYYPHGIGHFLGLNVHDVGTKSTVLEAGMVITCEPGIYIETEKIGIRIENDILITENGNIDLMEGFPITTDEIENLMKK